MNKHRAYWSQMHDERKEPSVKEKQLTELEKQIKIAMLAHGKYDVMVIFRKLYEEIDDNRLF